MLIMAKVKALQQDMPTGRWNERSFWVSLVVFFLLCLLRPAALDTKLKLLTQISTSEPSPASAVFLSEDTMIKFNWFNDDLIPSKAVLDMNIGTNYDPFGPQDDRYRILVDPLFGVCDSNAKLTSNVTSFCFAVSNYTGFATFNEYNGKGVSSSLAHVQGGTSHGGFDIVSKRTVLVLEAHILFTAIHSKSTQIFRLKLDLQGYELTVLRNIQTMLRDTELVVHVMAECFNPNEAGLQIYEVDNSCEKISTLLKDVGYVTKIVVASAEWGDVIAYKVGVATDFESQW